MLLFFSSTKDKKRNTILQFCNLYAMNLFNDAERNALGIREVRQPLQKNKIYIFQITSVDHATHL